ncbi:MAG TPA: bifunctional 3-deoxy-7-phosphoheptulonate synthase/chorismate mutase type II [Candidatus Avirikenella pullistercoris]|nr:bifunctional 3-deoxy-7-phosphoheptulonate synthase/chorismate mutase type II [Candidatus Avirikenella pullistercoris]
MLSLKSKKPLIISGPCSAETEEQLMTTCKELAATGKVDIIRAGIWKPRTRPGTFEGVGMKGLAWLANVKKETGLPVGVEVANAKHVESALEFGIDLLWIGARTTVNPFSVQDIADALKGVDVPVLIKNPMNPDIELWQGAVARLQAVGVKEIGLIHRGFSVFGASPYRNNPMWHMPIEMRRRMPELPMICDPSHIAGNRDLLYEVAQKSADLNFDGLIIESHINPCEAWSDASQQVTPRALEQLLDSIVWRKKDTDSPEYAKALEQLRGQIDNLDAELFAILAKRMGVAEKIGMVKKENNVAILQTNRWSEILDRAKSQSQKLGLSEDFLIKVLDAIHVESINHQNNVMNK